MFPPAGAVTVAANPAGPPELATCQVNLYLVPATNVFVTENILPHQLPLRTCSPLKVPPVIDQVKLLSHVACNVCSPDSVGV